MGEWIGDRAGEAVSALARRLEEVEHELKIAHMTLDAYDTPTNLTVGDMGRPLTLSERIQENHEKNRRDMLDAREAHLN
jgi:hypothetical protein